MFYANYLPMFQELFRLSKRSFDVVDQKSDENEFLKFLVNLG